MAKSFGSIATQSPATEIIVDKQKALASVETKSPEAKPPKSLTPVETFEAWAQSLGLMRTMALDSHRIRLVQNLMPLTMEKIPFLGSLLHLADRLEHEAEAIQQGLPAACPEVELINMLSTPKASLAERVHAVKARLRDQRHQLQLLDERIQVLEAEEDARLASNALSLAAGTAQTKEASKVDAALHKQRSQFAAAVERLSSAQVRAARDLLVVNLRDEASELRKYVDQRMVDLKEILRSLAVLIVTATITIGAPRDLIALKECYGLHDELREFIIHVGDTPAIVTDEQVMIRAQRSVDAKLQSLLETA